jgi:protein-tyrosine-phosphatase
MTNTLLTICSANICRSPLAVAVLDYAFMVHGLQHRITLRSRGMDVVQGQRFCELALQVARSNGIWTKLAEGHRATALEPGALYDADLILAADRRVRSRVIKLDPRAGERTFTFREAAALARLVAVDDHDRPHDLSGFAAALNDNRGLTDLPALERPSSLPWHRLKLHAYDVPDAHLDPHISHRVVYRTLVPAVQELASHLTAFASAGQR